MENLFENIRAFAFDIDGVFTDGSVLATAEGDLLRTFNSKDCFAVRTAVDHGFPVAFITGGCSASIVHRAHSLGIKDADLYQLSVDKRPDLESFCADHGLDLSQVAFVGDDLPDIPALQVAGLSVCPADAVEEVKAVCRYVSPYGGGRGCVRDLIVNVLEPKGKWYFNPQEKWSGKHPDHILANARSTGRFLKEK